MSFFRLQGSLFQPQYSSGAILFIDTSIISSTTSSTPSPKRGAIPHFLPPQLSFRSLRPWHILPKPLSRFVDHLKRLRIILQTAQFFAENAFPSQCLPVRLPKKPPTPSQDALSRFGQGYLGVPLLLSFQLLVCASQVAEVPVDELAADLGLGDVDKVLF